LFGFIRDWRYRLKCRQLLRHVGTAEAHQILESPDHFDAFCEGLPSQAPAEVMADVGEDGAGNPILDAITKLFQWAWTNRNEIIKFILTIISLFPKTVFATVATAALAGFPLPTSWGNLVDLFHSGGEVMAEATKLLEQAGVGLGEVITYIPVIAKKLETGVTDAKQIVDEITAMIAAAPKPT
jgi:hypothetical protein